MKFEMTFEISPPGVFGVPEDGRTVLPARPGEYIGEAIHTATLTRVGYGSLSEFRREEEAITLPLNLRNVQGRMQDNFIFLQIDASTYREAYDRVVQVLEIFLQHLSLSQTRSFTYKPLIIESEDGRIYPVPKVVTISAVTSYNLEHMKQTIQEAEAFCSFQDSVLERALQYFDHALLLYEKRGQIDDVLSRHYQKLIAAVFLNLWKAVSTIVGDPSTDNDYQRRYKKFGFNHDFFKSKIEHLRNMRNSYDVAHYSLDDNLNNTINANFGEAQNIAAEVLRRYRQYLLNKQA
jgi:hypothetical protein